MGSGVSRSGFAALVNAVWGLFSVSTRTVTTSVNSDKTGYSVSTVTDKTGYALTAGSYTVHAQNNQPGTIFWDAATSNTGAISPVTLAHTVVHNLGTSSGGSTTDRVASKVVATTNILLTASSVGTGSGNTLSYIVEDTV